MLTFTVTNPIPFAEAITFTDNLPSGLRVAAPPGIAGTCSNAVAATNAAAGGTSITVTGVTVPASGSCTVRVNVTNAPGQLNASCSTNPAAFTNSSSNISGLSGASTAPMAASCVVVQTPVATLRLAKAWGTNGGSADGFITVAAPTGATANPSGLFATAGSAGSSSVTGTVATGETITFAPEVFNNGAVTASRYSTVLSCLANGGPTANALSGTDGQASNTLVVGAGDMGKAIICTYTNALKPATLRLDKTWAPTPSPATPSP